MKQILIILGLSLGLAMQVNAEVRQFICEDKKYPMIPDFKIFIDVDSQIMRTETFGNIQQTLFFTDRYILNVNYNNSGDIGGMTLLFDRYTLEAVTAFTQAKDFSQIKQMRKGLLGYERSLFNCVEKKI